MMTLRKPSKNVPALKIGPSNTLLIAAGVMVDSFAYSDTPVTLPVLVGGEDYRVWILSDGTPVCLHWDTLPTDTNAYELGGFHYSPGGLPGDIDVGGTTSPQINPWSLWDKKYGPNCINARGMARVLNSSVWADIYFVNMNHQSLGTSRNNQPIATGNSSYRAIRAYDYGGYGTSRYANNIMWNYNEIFAQHGKRLGTYLEHCLAAFGVREGMGRGNHPYTTGLGTTNVGSRHPDHYFTSKCGLIQAAGVLWSVTSTPATWRGSMGAGAAADPKDGWDAYAITGGKPGAGYPLEMSRGQGIMQTDYDGAYVMHGGKYGYEDICGSRAFENIEKLWDSSENFSARGFADHLGVE